MRVHRDPPACFAPPFLMCLDCGGYMRLGTFVPSRSQDGYDELTYRREECNVSRKHVIKAAKT
jgi:hypothetical protein